jgi:hypothetical protein
VYGSETWSVTLRKEVSTKLHGVAPQMVEYRLRVFKNMVMRRMFGHRQRKQQNGGECCRREGSLPDNIAVIKQQGVRWVKHESWHKNRKGKYY